MLNKLLYVLCFCLMSFIHTKSSYHVEDVKIYQMNFFGNHYHIIELAVQKSEQKIKTKYFAGENIQSVPILYNEWAKDKQIIFFTSASYMTYLNDKRVSMGLSIDKGVILNKELKNDNLDALVLIYQNGSIQLHNLKEKIILFGGKIHGMSLDIRGNSMHKNAFLEWCQQQKVSVFQTHLLINNDEKQVHYAVGANYQTKRERKFLVIAKNASNQVVHYLIYSLDNRTMYDATHAAFYLLKGNKNLHQISMINLDTGGLNILDVFNSNGTKNPTIRGFKEIKEATNLLVYYYE